MTRRTRTAYGAVVELHGLIFLLEGGFICMLRLRSKVLPALRHFPSVRAGDVSRECKSDDDDGRGCCTTVVLLLPWDIRVFQSSHYLRHFDVHYLSHYFFMVQIRRSKMQ